MAKVFVTFSGDSYDVPNSVNDQKEAHEEKTVYVTENIVAPPSSKGKFELDGANCNSTQDHQESSKESTEISENKSELRATGSNVIQEVVTEKDNTYEQTKIDPIDPQESLVIENDVKQQFHDGSMQGENGNKNDSSKNYEHADEDLKTVEGESLAQIDMERANMTSDNCAEAKKSDDIKIDQIYITEPTNDSLGNDIDASPADIEKKEYSESVVSDQNNNEIPTDQDQIEKVDNDESFQMNSDRVYPDGENTNHLSDFPREAVYINLMKDTLLDKDSQISFPDIDAKLGDSARSETRPQTTSTMREVPGGLRAKANTPASFYMASNDPESFREDKDLGSGRAASRVSREEVFQRAMTLMSNRCTSAREDDDVLFSSREPPFGIHIPQYFYVQQKKPVPMAPLKVWRGYKGNVYFEPMSIKSVMQSNDLYSVPGTAMSGYMSTSRAPTRATTAGTKKSYRLVNSSSQVFIMDKHNVVRSDNYDLEQDLHYIEGMESTGSLAIRPPSSSSSHMINHRQPSAKQKDKRLLYKRERICKGSNVSNFHKRTVSFNDNNNKKSSSRGGYDHYSSRTSHTSGTSRKSSLASSKFSSRKKQSVSAGYKGVSNQDLMVSGDKFSFPTIMSPILRTNNHGHLSLHGQHRPMTETPDVYKYKEYADDQSLDRVHVSMEHMDISDENFEKTGSFDQNDSFSDTAAPFVDISFKKAAVNSY